MVKAKANPQSDMAHKGGLNSFVQWSKGIDNNNVSNTNGVPVKKPNIYGAAPYAPAVQAQPMIYANAPVGYGAPPTNFVNQVQHYQQMQQQQLQPQYAPQYMQGNGVPPLSGPNGYVNQFQQYPNIGLPVNNALPVQRTLVSRDDNSSKPVALDNIPMLTSRVANPAQSIAKSNPTPRAPVTSDTAPDVVTDVDEISPVEPVADEERKPPPAEALTVNDAVLLASQLTSLIEHTTEILVATRDKDKEAEEALEREEKKRIEAIKRKRKEDKLKMKSLLKQLEHEKRPMWRHKLLGHDVKQIPEDKILKGKSLFRCIAVTILKLYCKPLLLVRAKQLARRESDRDDLAKTLQLFMDPCSTWLGKLVKTPMLSVQKVRCNSLV